MRSKKYRVTLIILGILLVATISIGISYSYWKKTHQQISRNEIKSGCLEIKFEELTNSISLTNSYPMAAENAENLTPYRFKITNICTIAAKYHVTLNTLNIQKSIANENVRVSILPYGLFSAGETINNLKINPDTGSLNNSNLKESYFVDSGYLGVNDDVTYDAYIWIDENAGNEIMGQSFEASIDVISVATPTLSTIRKATTTTSPLIAGHSSVFVSGRGNVSLLNRIRSVEFVDSNIVPSNVLDSWDVSQAQDGSIMVWVETNGTCGTAACVALKLYVGQEGGVIANQDSSYLFYGFRLLDNVKLNYLDTSLAKNMNYMFYNAHRYEYGVRYSLNLNTSNVLTMEGMFHGVGNIMSFYNSVTLSFGENFDTSKVVNMKSMFSEIGRFKVDLNFNDKFTLNKVYDASYMFNNTAKSADNLVLNLRTMAFNDIVKHKDMFGSSKTTTTIYVKDTQAATWIRERGYIGSIIDCSLNTCP